MHQPTTPNLQNPHCLRHEVRGWACRDAVRTGCEWDEAYSGRAKALRVYEKRKPAGATLLDITSPFFISLLPPLLASSQSGRQLSRLDFFGTFCIKTKSTERKEHYAEATALYFYHPDHLGSSSWITYTNGRAIEHLHYLPYGETQVDQRATSYAARYTFSAKEKDEETGYSYFGARYYNSDLSVWLSVDPMSDKYPNMSPYVYCANNPVKLVDPDGKDYEVVVDDESKTMTIKAVYYTSSENKEKLKKGLDAWNAQSGKFSYVMGKGKDKQSYTVNFKLTIAEGDVDSQTARSAFGEDNSRMANFVESSDEVYSKDHSAPANGEASNNVIRLRPEASIRTIAHEVGHTLGIGDWQIPGPDQEDYGELMTSGGQSDVINKSHIATILRVKGYGLPSSTWGFTINPFSEDFSVPPSKATGLVKQIEK